MMVNVDHADTYTSGTVVNFSCSDGAVVLTLIQGASECGAGYRTIKPLFCACLVVCHALFETPSQNRQGSMAEIVEELSNLHDTLINDLPEMQLMHLHHNAQILLPWTTTENPLKTRKTTIPV